MVYTCGSPQNTCLPPGAGGPALGTHSLLSSGAEPCWGLQESCESWWLPRSWGPRFLTKAHWVHCLVSHHVPLPAVPAAASPSLEPHTQLSAWDSPHSHLLHVL